MGINLSDIKASLRLRNFTRVSEDKSISMPKGHGFALTPYKGALVHLCYETLRNKFNFLK